MCLGRSRRLLGQRRVPLPPARITTYMEQTNCTFPARLHFVPVMSPQTYDSVTDRLGAFNEATEKMSKSRVTNVICVVTSQPGCELRLLKTDDYYRFEVAGAVPGAGEGALLEMKFAREGDIYARNVRRAERSWNVASQMEDILGDVFGLPPDTAVSVDIQ